ncbi:MAG TPA: nicotinate phosphoribosyltransferase [Actinomycetota bacterium]|nr:nicotinate phosphoribosyltransferase [Actinomycetota bacterium]
MEKRRAGTWVGDDNVALLTDLYELTMAASYHRHDLNGTATFDLFIRSLPPQRSFLVVCGVEDAVSYLESLSFDDGALAYLRSLGIFDDDFLDYLSRFSFSGDVVAMREGEIAFGGEPIVRVTAPLIEAQFVETFLLNAITFQTMVASKAARVAIACGDRRFVDFSLRRDHGADAGLKAARAAFVGGAAATSNVLAGRFYGIPLSGTMAHSYVLAFPSELEAFRTYASHFGNDTILLVDTFDIAEGARNAATVAREAKETGMSIRGVRIDSGDLVECAKVVRTILDEAGLPELQIFASGDLDEYEIERLLAAEAPIDAFGVGTQLGTSGDAPALGGAYKLVEDEAGPKMKLSTGKVTLPGRKQVYRRGAMEEDVIALEDEEQEGRPLLEPIVRNGRRIREAPPLEETRAFCRRNLDALPDELRALRSGAPYPVRLSPRLEELVERMRARR